MSGTPAWRAERTVGAGEAAALIEARFPDLRGAPVEPLATGWDNTVHLVGGEWIFRFPRREVVLPGLRREIAYLPRLAPRLPLAVPVPEHVGEPGEDFPWPFWGARIIPGRELAEAPAATAAQDVRVARELGAFLRALHDPALAAEAGAGLPYDPLRRGDPAVRAPRARTDLDALAEQGLWTPDPAVLDALDAGERSGAPDGSVVCHGDLHIRHLLVQDGHATGVIDWIDLCLGDPALDLSLAYSGFAGPARAALLEAYGEVTAGSEAAARVLAIFLCGALARYAADEGHLRLLEAALAGIGRAAR
ncbi:MAG: phosphotransferase [Streptosporangiales bacterium]|nr:phosphotransferase [Streptosporangiales bacterium]